MKVSNQFRGMSEFGGEHPRRFFVRTFVSGPSDQIQEFAGAASVVDLGVKNCLNLVFRFSVDFDRRRRRLNAIRDGVRCCWFQLRNVKDRMYGPHTFGESKGEGVRSDLGDDFEGAQVLLGKLLGRSSGSEESCFDEDVISDLELRCGHSSCVSRTLVSALGFSDLRSEFLLEFV